MLAFAGLAPPLLTRPSSHHLVRTSKILRLPVRNAPAMALDPVTVQHALQHSFHHIASPHTDFHSLSLLLSDATAAVDSTAATVQEANKTGAWKSFVKLIEDTIVLLHNQLANAGVPNAYGLSIILFTIGIKAITFPLNFKQTESTMRMQIVSPKLKKIQAAYKDNPTVLNQMTAKLYKDENINPLAGCLPVFVQIPVWVALYRSLLNLAADNLMDESFLWLPSLQGPVSKTGQGIGVWLFPFQNGAPPIGWHDAICYLILPVALVASQFASQKIMQPPNQDPSQQPGGAFMKFLPFMIGWFALQTPSGLSLYWATNTIVTTAQTVFIRSRFPGYGQPPTTSESDSSDDTDAIPSSSLEDVDGFTSPTKKSSTKGSKSKKRRKRR